MAEVRVTCPSGLKGVVRGLKGREINLFANKAEIRKRRVGTRILDACWLRIEDVGLAYPWVQDGQALDWNRVLTADRFTSLLKVREATYGPNYAFPWQCDRCDRRFEWELNLNDLPFKPLREDVVQQFLKDNRFPVAVADDEIVFKLSIGQDEKRALEARDLAPDRIATTGLLQRIVSVNGETDQSKLLRWAEDLDVEKVLYLIDELDEYDGGIETDIEVQCDRCGWTMDISLPLEEDFWTPRKSRRSRKQRAST